MHSLGLRALGQSWFGLIRGSGPNPVYSFQWRELLTSSTPRLYQGPHLLPPSVFWVPGVEGTAASFWH